MQSFFATVDLAAYRQQQQAVANYLAEQPPRCCTTPSLKRAVGRPKKKRAVNEVLEAATDAADTAATQVNKRVRGEYTRWFNSPYINDILHAHTLQGGSARRTVDFLQQHAPDDRFKRLSHSTVAGWFDKSGKLLEKHQHELAEGCAADTNSGRIPALDAAPGAEEAICDNLLLLRQAGMPLHSHVIRWVMLAVLEKHPVVLQQITLSQQFISKFVRSNPRLHFRWRARTTAASKLPDDWEEQGIQMAQRVGATMQLHKVRITLGIRQAAVFLTYSSRIPCVFLAYSCLFATDPSLPCDQYGSDRSASGVCFVVHLRDGRQQRCGDRRRGGQAADHSMRRSIPSR
jgi:hypothetical protein